MNSWSQALLAGCFIMLALLVGLFAYQFVEIRPLRPTSSDSVSAMVAAVETRLMRNIDEAVRRLDGVEQRQLSSDAIRTIIRTSVEEALASAPPPRVAAQKSSAWVNPSAVPAKPAHDQGETASSFSVVPASTRPSGPMTVAE